MQSHRTMIEYVSPNVPIVPRILPNQQSVKKFSMVEDVGYQYAGNRSPNSPFVSPTRAPPQQNELPAYPVDKSRPRRGLYHEPLKDNSGEYWQNNSYQLGENPYLANGHDRPMMNCFNGNASSYWKATLVVYGIVVGLFSLTALTISIYLLARFSRLTTL